MRELTPEELEEVATAPPRRRNPAPEPRLREESGFA